MNTFILTQNNGIANVCLSGNAPLTAVTAAGELVRCLSAMTGLSPIIRYGKPTAGDIYLAGHSTNMKIDELCIEIHDDILCIDGGERGIIYGVYELLEQLGCRFLAEDCEILPQTEILTLPGDLCIHQNPVFEYRCTSWIGSNVKTAPKFRLNANHGFSLPEAWGDGISYEGFVHTLGALSEMEGDYTDRQPCLTDEKTFQTVVKNLRKRLAANPKATIASVSQNDSHEWGRGCTCPSCKALDDAEGSPIGSLLTFVNRVAEELEPEYPDLAIDTLAYRYTRKPPKTLRSRHNVIVRLCSIECCFSHPMDECDSSVYDVEDGGFADTLREWSKHSDRIYIWDYTTNFRSFHNMFPNFSVLRRNARFMAENHVRGVFEQGDHETINGEFGALRTYLLSKVLWDPYMSEETYQQHINDFLAGYYGEGWQSLRRFLDRLQTAAKDVHFGIYFEDPTELFLDPETEGDRLTRAAAFLEKGRADFSEALRKATPEQRRRIQRSEIQLDLYEWYLRNAHLQTLSQDDPEYAEADEALLTAAANLHAHTIAHGIVNMFENFKTSDYLGKMPEYRKSPAFW